MSAEHFTFNFTVEQVRELLDGNREADMWYDAMCEILPVWGITTPERVAGFMAQCAHESGGFKRLEENLNYSADSLRRVFGRYFGPGKEDADEYHRNPEKIANYVYMDEYRSSRGALGNIYEGDGWKFRGRGLKQLTGRNNYAAFGITVDMTADEAADYVATKQGAIDSACWFWDTNKIDRYADSRDIVGMTKRINGGTIGLEDRTRRWNHALSLFTGESQPEVTPTVETTTQLRFVKKGSRGPLVQQVQEALGIGADGIFGPGTERAVKSWQEENGLVADGIVGPKSLAVLLGE
mgnify:CR=1 FL=1